MSISTQNYWQISKELRIQFSKFRALRGYPVDKSPAGDKELVKDIASRLKVLKLSNSIIKINDSVDVYV